jgi:hypothetical protein
MVPQLGSEMDLCSQIRHAGFDVVFDDRILVKHYSSPRPEGEDRHQLNGSLFLDISFNNHYLVAKQHFGLGRALAFFAMNGCSVRTSCVVRWLA